MYKTKNLRAEFRFNDEVAPNKRKEVEIRIEKDMDSYLKKKGFKSGDYEPVFHFLPETYKGRLLRPWRPDIQVELRLRRCVFGLGFNLSAKVQPHTHIQLEQILDLKELNRFILTGEE